MSDAASYKKRKGGACFVRVDSDETWVRFDSIEVIRPSTRRNIEADCRMTEIVMSSGQIVESYLPIEQVMKVLRRINTIEEGER